MSRTRRSLRLGLAEEQVTEVTEQTCAAYEQGRIASLLGMEGGHTIVMDGGVVAAS